MAEEPNEQAVKKIGFPEADAKDVKPTPEEIEKAKADLKFEQERKAQRRAQKRGNAKVLRLTSRAKSRAVQHVAQRGGKTIGRSAAKRVTQKVVVQPVAQKNGKDKPVARPKGAQDGFTDSQKITRLKKPEERAAKGTAKHEQFLLYKNGIGSSSRLINSRIRSRWSSK